MTIWLSVMRMTVQHQISSMPIDNLCHPRSTKKRENLRRLALYRFGDRRVMHYDHTFRRAKLRNSPLQFQRFVDRRLHKVLDLTLAECSQYPASKSSYETLRTGKAYPIALVATAIQNLNATGDQHAAQFFFLTAFVVVITQYH